MARILVVDDHPLYCEGLAHAARRLRPDWEIRFAHSAQSALATLPAGEFDLTIVDVGLPDVEGFALLRMIAAQYPRLPQILISGRNDAAVRVRAGSCGARGFIAKTMAPEVIVETVEAVLRGDNPLNAPLKAEAGIPRLSTRQAEVLELLSEGHGNKEIRHRLGIAERTVRAHLTELFQLLDAHSRTQALIRARELGLIA